MGVSQMELVNKFDNALSGVAGDEGATGSLVNTANFLETGSFWDMQHLPADVPARCTTRTRTTRPPADSGRRSRAGRAVRRDRAGVRRHAARALPLYPARSRTATTAASPTSATYTIRGHGQAAHDLRPRPHERRRPARPSLDLIESLRLPRRRVQPLLVDPGRLPADLQAAAASSRRTPATAPASWRSGSKHLTWADPRYYLGFGFGADINGLGAQGDPRGADAPATRSPTRSPGLGGVTVDKQVSGQRVYDINKDGVAHYGLYPDWIQDLRKIAAPGRRTIVDGHGPRPRGLPADVGAGLRRQPTTPAATRGLCAPPPSLRGIPTGLDRRRRC